MTPQEGRALLERVPEGQCLTVGRRGSGSARWTGPAAVPNGLSPSPAGPGCAGAGMRAPAFAPGTRRTPGRWR